ncbi:hypothetical protein GO495_00830 [Chitinophaga oryziterrae]|uniref:Ricin B lectin domain-containing protein n=1 Tax=Chitinophaga oryziterrae TaxID=1031224 RepID=A0A6N8J4M6_9BACT|nr:RICIN domain-containing protein [Chitinophaga oryziterrae]MVT39112.1 hypothetical protein [Chitinophaga oryziterrae]
MKSFIFLAVVLLLCSTLPAVMAQEIKGDFAIKNVQQGLLLRVKDAGSANGTPLVVYEPENWKCMTWNFEQVNGQVYKLKNLFTGKTFEAAKPAAGEAFTEQPLVQQSTAQQYEFVPLRKNVYLIKLQGTDLYLTPAGADAKINTPVILAKKNGTAAQEWTIYEQHPTM